MALDVAGRHAEAERAYEWLAAIQLHNGSWHAYYLADGVEDHKLDTNVSPTSPRACGTTGCSPGPRLRRGACGRPSSAPSTGCCRCRPRAARSSGPATRMARRGPTPCSRARRRSATPCAARSRLAETAGRGASRLGARRGEPGRCVAHVPDAFAPKHRWAMDWYYPVLAGVLTGRRGARPAGRALGHVRDGGPRRSLREQPSVGRRRPRPASARSPTSPWATRRRARAVHLDAAHRARRRLVLDRPRRTPTRELPRRRAQRLHGRRRHPRRRRPRRASAASGLFLGEDIPAFIDTSDPVTD